MATTFAVVSAAEIRETGSIKFDIAGKDLAEALNEFALQSKKDVLFAPEIAATKTSNPVHGSYEPLSALRIILRGTGLTFRSADERTILVDVAGQDSKSTSADARSMESQLAQVTPPAARQDRATQSELRGEFDRDTVAQSTKGIPEVLVKGSRSLNADIERTRDDPQPYVVFDRKQIVQSGAANLDDFLKTRLPMNSVAATFAQGAASTGAKITGSQINLRGLGTNQTLILVDGRRMASGNAGGGSPTQPDITSIPLAAIERIEVLPTTASAIYGGSATGGVINIILRRDYAGVETRLTYDITSDGHAPLSRIEAASGFNLGAKTNVALSGSFADQAVLKVGERNFLRRARELRAANGGFTSFVSSGTPPLGATPNIRSANGSNLVLDNGTPLNSPIAFVPVGYAGGDGGAAFLTTAGRFNLDLADSAQTGGKQSPLLPANTLKSVNMTLRHEFTPRVEAFVQGAMAQNRATEALSIALSNAAFSNLTTVAATAPNNPFQQAVMVAVPSSAFDRQVLSVIDDQQASVGTIVKLPRSWTSELGFNWSRSAFNYRSVLTSVSPTIGSQIASGNVNVLRDLNLYPVDLSPYVDPALVGAMSKPVKTTLKDSVLRLAGPLGVEVKGGAIQLASLLEYREESLSDAVSNVGVAGFDPRSIPSRSQAIRSAYAEARVPLLISTELQLSLRHDAYTTRGAIGFYTSPNTPLNRSVNEVSSTDPTVAIRFQPVSDVALRASYGTGFLPPAVDQLAPTYSTNASNVGADPKRGGTSAIIPAGQLVTGGNPNLRPEQSKTYSFGVILTPRWISQLRVSVDFSRIRKTDNIALFPGSYVGLMNNEQLYPERVVRGPRLAGDPADWAGPIIFMDASRFNLATADVQAYDLQFDYKLDLERFGSLSFTAIGTRQMHYKTRTQINQPQIENVGITPDNPLKWRGNGGVQWNKGAWTAGWTARYFDSYWINAARTVDVFQGAASMPSQTYHDVFATFRPQVGQGMLNRFVEDADITLGARNVFNTSPPINANSTVAGYSVFADPRLASYYLNLRLAF